MAETKLTLEGKLVPNPALLHYLATSSNPADSLLVEIALVSRVYTGIPFPMAIVVKREDTDETGTDTFFLNAAGDCTDHTQQTWLRTGGSDQPPQADRYRSLDRLRFLTEALLSDRELPDEMKSRLRLALV